MSAAAFTHRTGAAGRWCAVALGFSIPISVAVDNLLLALVLAGWLLSGALRDTITVVRGNPVCAAALVLLALLAAGTAYGNQAPGDAAYSFKKYLDLLLIPVFAWFFRDAATRRIGLLALAGSLALTLVLSLGLKLGVVPQNALMTGDAASPTAFKLRLTHNILMAFGAFLFAWFAATEESRRWRIAWGILAVLAALNVTMMVQGATGYLILGALGLLFAYGIGRWRGFGIAALAVTSAALLLAYLPGPFQERVSTIDQEFRGWEAHRPQTTSIGLRLEFYRNTLRIIAEHPVIGVGTGGFPRAYEDHVRGSGMASTRNPHSEFLHLTAQLGPLGLAALLWLFWQQWRTAPRLAGVLERELARGLVAAMVIGCLYNSLLLDHTEGLLYAWLTGLLYGGVKSGGNG